MSRWAKPFLALGSISILAICVAILMTDNSSALTPENLFKPTWTRSYQLYGQPHAVWLSNYDRVGTNLPLLRRVLNAAAQANQVPELVIYTIPLRDLGQSSEGGFSNYSDYYSDNWENAKLIKRFVEETGIRPIIYLEPDSLPLAVQYRLDNNYSAESEKIYTERIRAIRALIALYQNAGAKAYLEAGHSDWFDYGDENIQRIANALNEAGIASATGLATNVSNRQPVISPTPGGRSEFHYLTRLIPRLNKQNPDVRVDTSRNGGSTVARRYYLAPDGRLWDSETRRGRLVGSWKYISDSSDKQDIRLLPFFGKPKRLSLLLAKEKYTWDAKTNTLTAPVWLDAVGDVQPGPAPTDLPPVSVRSVIGHYRYIKPPDDCDGALNCPPGASKHDINEETAKRQPEDTPNMPWR